MSRNLRRAALAAAAAALAAAAMGSDSRDDGVRSSPEYRAAPGHLGLLARAHPSLRRDLAALLTPEAFLLDATHALAAAALCSRPISGEMLRLMRCDPRAAQHSAEYMDKIGPEAAWSFRVGRALCEAKDGRFEDALAAFARLAAERPCDPGPRLAAAGICYLVGRQEEGDRWVAGIPESVRSVKKMYLRKAILSATLGGAPPAVAGFEGLVGWVAFEVINIALWAKFVDGDMSFLKMSILSALLRCVVAGKYKGYYKGMVAEAPSKE